MGICSSKESDSIVNRAETEKKKEDPEAAGVKPKAEVKGKAEIKKVETKSHVQGGTRVPSDSRFAGKTALITGASSGIGRASALELARAGANVVVAARREDRLASLVREIDGFGGNASAVKLDVTSEDANRQAVRAAVEKYGSLDIVFLNAGVFSSLAKPIWETDPNTWQKNYNVNVFGVFYGLKAALAQMVAQGKGGSVIVNSSAGGLESKEALQGHSGYTSSKFAVTGIVKYVAAEAAGHNIRVNAIAAGAIETPMAGGAEGAQSLASAVQIIKRPGKPKDVASAVLFLADPDNSFVTGISLSVDGGFTSS